MYLHFFGGSSAGRDPSSGTPYYSYDNQERGTAAHESRARNKKGKKGRFDVTLNSQMGTQLQPGDPEDNVMWSECRRTSSAKSTTASEIPLEPQIQKKTEFYVHEDGHSETSNPDHMETDGGKSNPRRYF